MKPKIKNIIYLLFLISFFSCQPFEEEVITIESPKNSAISQDIFNPLDNGYKLVWEDNFDGTQLDLTKWRHRAEGPSRAGFYDRRMTKVKDGNLLLIYDHQRDSVFAAQVGTQETYQRTYGYFECRMKVNKGYPQSAAFWLQSPKIWQGENPAIFGTEIDIAEYQIIPGELGVDHMTHCLHWAYGPNQRSSGRMESYLHGLSKGYHTYALEWTPEK